MQCGDYGKPKWIITNLRRYFLGCASAGSGPESECLLKCSNPVPVYVGQAPWTIDLVGYKVILVTSVLF